MNSKDQTHLCFFILMLMKQNLHKRILIVIKVHVKLSKDSHDISNPQSIVSPEPVIIEASGEDRKIIPFAISSGSISRGNNIRLLTGSITSCLKSSGKLLMSSVFTRAKRKFQ